MLDLTLFENRLFSAAAAAAFIDGLSRFALMFLFVFYFQGPQGQSPIMAGLELVAAGARHARRLADRRRDRRSARLARARGARDGRHRGRHSPG